MFWFVLSLKISENSTCFEENPVTSEIPTEIRKHCDGREILILNPIECKETPRKMMVNDKGKFLLVIS